jgi:hypothetical protein
MVGLAMLIVGAREEMERAELLRRLRREGEQVRAANLSIEEHRGGYRRGVSYVSVRYRFLPLGRKESVLPDQSTLPATDDPRELIARLNEQTKALDRVGKDDPWESGSSMISGEMRTAINDGDWTVTYLREMPQVNAIGPLSDKRISSEWRRNALFVDGGLAIALSLLIGGISAAAHWRKLPRRKQVQAAA